MHSSKYLRSIQTISSCKDKGIRYKYSLWQRLNSFPLHYKTNENLENEVMGVGIDFCL